MISFKKLARKEEAAEKIWCDFDDRNKFIPVVLWLAHAISRGRRPSSSHLLPGVNLQDWLHHMYANTREGHRDYSDEPCSLATYMIDFFYEMGSFDGGLEDEERQRIVRAIQLVGNRLLRRRRLPAELRGDPRYQTANQETNLKRKRRYWARRNGHWHYDEVMDYMY